MNRNGILRKLSFHRRSGHHADSVDSGSILSVAHPEDGDEHQEMKTFANPKGQDDLKKPSTQERVRKISFENGLKPQRAASMRESPDGNANIARRHPDRKPSVKRSQPKPNSNTLCPVCGKDLTHPKILPCKHVACGDCLKRFINPKDLLSCPVCHKEHPVLRGDMDNLPDDDRSIRLMKVRQKTSTVEAINALQPTKSTIEKLILDLQKIEESLGSLERSKEEHLKELLAKADDLFVKKMAALNHQREKFQESLDQKLAKESRHAKRIRTDIHKIYELECQVEGSETASTDDHVLMFKEIICDYGGVQGKLSALKNTEFELADDFSIIEVIKEDKRPSVHESANGEVSSRTGIIQHHAAPKLHPVLTFKTHRNYKPFGGGLCPWNDQVFVCLADKKMVEVFDGQGKSLRLIESAPNFNLLHPIQIAFDETDRSIFILDKWEHNIKIIRNIEKLDSGEGSDCILGKGTGLEGLLDPCGMAMDKLGNIYVADTANARVQKLTKQGKFVTMIGGAQELDRAGNVAWVTYLSHPEDVAVNQEGSLVVVADTGNNRVKVFSSNGDPLHEIGMKGCGDGEFDVPICVAFHPLSNTILVGEIENHRIQLFDQKGTFVRSNTHFKGAFSIVTSDSERNLTLIVESKSNTVTLAK